MAKRTPEQLTALFTEMGEAEVAKALSSRRWRTKAYNTLALEWLTKLRTAKATEKTLERSQSTAKGDTVPKVEEEKVKAVEERTESRRDVESHNTKPRDADKNTHRNKNKPKGAK